MSLNYGTFHVPVQINAGEQVFFFGPHILYIEESTLDIEVSAMFQPLFI